MPFAPARLNSYDFGLLKGRFRLIIGLKQMDKGIERKGFTLIELLVVVAVIAIVAAILLPVFATAKVQARRVGCASNMKQMAYAYQMYLGDYDDLYPDNDLGANLWLVEPYLRQRKIKQYDSQKTALSVWLCPGVEKDMYYICWDRHWARNGIPPPWGPIGSTVKVFNSYVLNDAVTKAGSGRPGLVRRPSKTVLFAEGCKQPDRISGACGTAPTAVHPNLASELDEVIGWCHCVVPGSKSLIHPWHNGGANFMFVDWHVSFRTQPPPTQDWLP